MYITNKFKLKLSSNIRIKEETDYSHVMKINSVHNPLLNVSNKGPRNT